LKGLTNYFHLLSDDASSELPTDAETAEHAEVPTSQFEEGDDENQLTREDLADDFQGAVQNIPEGDEEEGEHEDVIEQENEISQDNEEMSNINDESRAKNEALHVGSFHQVCRRLLFIQHKPIDLNEKSHTRVNMDLRETKPCM